MNYYKGNFRTEPVEHKERKGWIIGRFLDGFNKNQFVAVKSWSYDKGQDTSNHPRKYEREATETTFILKGKVRGILDDEQIILKAGEYVTIPPTIISNLVEEILEDVEGLTIKSPSLSERDSVKLTKEAIESEKEIKIVIPRQPRDWVNLVALVLVPLASLYFAYISSVQVDKQYQQLLPLKEANLTFSESDIKIYQNAQNFQTNSLGDGIEPSITNIGQATAKNINFTIYTAPFNSKLGGLTNIFNDRIIQDLESGEKVTFGNFIINYKSSTGVDLSPLKGYEQIALVFHIKYTDSLTNQTINKIRLFQYTFGANTAHALLGADYSKLYQALLQGVASSSDENLRRYFDDNKPITL